MQFPEFETGRLFLKNITVNDAAFLLRVFSHPKVNRFLYDEEPVASLRQAEELVRRYWPGGVSDRNRWKIVDKASGEEMGTCGFHRWEGDKRRAEVGYDLLPEYWGHGYIREAVVPVFDFLRSSRAARTLRAVIYRGNERSIATAEKLGFQKTSEIEMTEFHGESHEHHIYELQL